MIWWVLGLTVLSILSYLADVGMIRFQGLRVPGLNASPLSLLILLAAAGLLVRMLWLRKQARREMLEKKIRELEGKLAGLAGPKTGG